ncbi:MAG: hypothetical protein V3V00_00570 [Saprospiraceae bacterium]
MKETIFLIACITLFCTSCHKEECASFDNVWEEDVCFFGENLKSKHKDLFFNIPQVEYDYDINTLQSNTSTLSELDIIIGLKKVISKIGDSHTGIQIGTRLTPVPLRVQWFDDGIYITGIATSQEMYLGKKVIGIEGISIDIVLDSLKTVIAYENESNFKNQVIGFLQVVDFYKYFDFISNAEELNITIENGDNITLYPKDKVVVSLPIPELPLFLKRQNEFYWFEELPGEGLMYIQYNACAEIDNYPFSTFTDEISERININNSIKKIVLDLRHNGGGNSEVALPLITKLDDLVSSSRLQSSDIYVIISRKTFSSAILNAIELRKKISPIFIGEHTGGKPNHYGEVKDFFLPNSRLKVRYSSKYFKLLDTDEDALYPDIKVNYNYHHYISSLDPIMDRILAF